MLVGLSQSNLLATENLEPRLAFAGYMQEKYFFIVFDNQALQLVNQGSSTVQLNWSTRAAKLPS